jgi:hypothetical protein
MTIVLPPLANARAGNGYFLAQNTAQTFKSENMRLARNTPPSWWFDVK